VKRQNVSHPVGFQQFGQTLEHLELRRVCDLSTSLNLNLTPDDHLEVDEAAYEVGN